MCLSLKNRRRNVISLNLDRGLSAKIDVGRSGDAIKTLRGVK